MKLHDNIIKSWNKNLSDTFSEAGGKSQTSAVEMNCSYTVCQKIAEYGDKNGVLIHLCPSKSGAQSTTVAGSISGSMLINTHWSKYWFVSAVQVKITPDTASQDAGLYLGLDSPTTTQNKHQISSSISFNAGMFGDTPTGGVASSSSFSTTIDDFKVNNHTDLAKGVLNHEYIMAATSGGKFDSSGGGINWSSTINFPLVGWGFLFHSNSHGGLFGGVLSHPYDPPDVSVSNIPIASQGLWVAPEGFTGKTTFTISFNILYLATHSNAAGPQVKQTNAVFSSDLEIDWSQLNS